MQQSAAPARRQRWAKIAMCCFASLCVLIAAATGFVWWYDHAGQRSDPGFEPQVTRPAYAGPRRTVAIDAAHRNFHTASGRYRPLAALLGADGLEVVSNEKSFSPESLHGFDMLVIANAMGPDGKEDTDPFTSDEKHAVVNWVQAGGALLLIADHAPFGSAARNLAALFGVTMHLRYARDDRNHEGWDNERLTFSRVNGLLPSNQITNGRSESERISTVVSFTGQSLSGPSNCQRILPLAREAYDWESRAVRYPANGHAQALACAYGQGRVFVLGEAAMFSAQVDPLGLKFGMNRPGNDDRQFALNVVHWLLPPSDASTTR